ncbi:hypothetical protein BW12_02985 [Bifidobacterium sp. UTCIF-3]|nr:hypothetical protein BW09_03680 [Bifidobacterium sp. UTCIF-1]TPF80863.1 hypothetical protein BW08_02645 [Bifidobacterium sp. UTCIF-24]TPF82698.1 hypothetical protein BW12_02985 [Bifidobacterium sp. UTCIF-3]TPF84528.1 hypothetical protein BW07_04570 [Bifidobacterium sp. UTCIF-36]TPF90911.1 hypothetical protein BW10_01460 [Bifidobacterium sp. UTBIF-56]
MHYLANQTYTNIEIILIDDGSIDGSSDICDSWSRRDSRIITLHQNNQGVSAARNVGIETSTGQFIVFIDSDDRMSENLVEQCMKTINSTGHQIVMYKHIRTTEDGTPITAAPSNMFPVIAGGTRSISGIEAARLILQGKLFSMPFFFLAERQLYMRYNIRFPVGRAVMEDPVTVYKVFCKADTIDVLPEILYYYRERPTSAVSNSRNANSIICNISNLDEMAEFISTNVPQLQMMSANSA